MASSGPPPAGERPERRFMPDIGEHMGSDARAIFENYSKIPPADIDAHVVAVRDKGWKIWPYPCLGMFRFLDFSMPQSSRYKEILQRLKGGEALLDLGCGFGQELRKLVYDGAPSEKLYGADLRKEFIDQGYELFKDQGVLKATFVTGDIFEKGSFTELDGTSDIIYIGSFLHLFNREDQVKAATRMVSFLKDGRGKLILGRQVGSKEPGERSRLTNPGKTMYRHDATTMAALWDEVGAATGTKWKTTGRLAAVEDEAEAPPGAADDRVRLYFEVEKV